MSSSPPDLVVVTHPVFPETEDLLRGAGLAVDINPSPEPWPAAVLRERCAGAAALLAFMTDRVDAALLDACSRMRIVSCALRGSDNFDADACARRGVWLAIVPDLLTEPTAELALGLALALGRNLIPGDRLVRSGAFAGWRPALYGSGIGGARVGIAGFGQVGRAIAKRVAAFGPSGLHYHDVRRVADADAEPVSWDELLRQSDLLFLTLPLTPATHGLVGRAALARVRPECRIVNVGRGGVVDEGAMARALGAGQLAGYAADVFELEDWAVADRPRTIPASLLAMTDRTVFTPHLGSAVKAARQRIEAAAAGAIVTALRGERPPGAVNRPRTPGR